MEDTAQVPESQAALPQKPAKPTSIKILQWVYLIYAVFILVSPLVFPCAGCSYSTLGIIQLIINFSLLLITSFGLIIFSRRLFIISTIFSVIASFSVSQILFFTLLLFEGGVDITDGLVIAVFMPFIILSILSGVIIRNYFLLKNSFSLPKLWILLLFSFVIILAHFLFINLSSKDIYSETIQLRKQEGETMRNLESNYNLMKPTYLPSQIDGGSDEIRYGGLVTFYSCGNGLFRISQYPLSLSDSKRIQEIIKEPGYDYKKGLVSISGRKVTIYEKQVTWDKSIKGLDQRYFVWETSDLLIIAGGISHPCILSKGELIKIAESMQPRK